MDYKEKFIKQRSRNTWFVYNFIMGDESMTVKRVDAPEFKSKKEKFNWYLNQINIKI